MLKAKLKAGDAVGAQALISDFRKTCPEESALSLLDLEVEIAGKVGGPTAVAVMLTDYENKHPFNKYVLKQQKEAFVASGDHAAELRVLRTSYLTDFTNDFAATALSSKLEADKDYCGAAATLDLLDSYL